MTMENAIKHLENMKWLNGYSNTTVDGVPIGNVIDGIIALLKAQEPRVMTLEELAAAQKTPVWRETKRAHKDIYNGWMLAYDIQRGQGITGTRQGMTEPNGRIGWYKLDDYGKTWRCWTSRPDEKRRAETPWN